jgi:hypothetical protein
MNSVIAHAILSLDEASELSFTYYHVLLLRPCMTQMVELIDMLVLPYTMLLLCSDHHASVNMVSGLPNTG